MALFSTRRKVHCPQCGHDGREKLRGTGGWFKFFWLLSIPAGVLFFVIWLFTIVGFLWMVLRAPHRLCAVCGWENLVPLKQWHRLQKEGC